MTSATTSPHRSATACDDRRDPTALAGSFTYRFDDPADDRACGARLDVLPLGAGRGGATGRIAGGLDVRIDDHGSIELASVDARVTLAQPHPAGPVDDRAAGLVTGEAQLVVDDFPLPAALSRFGPLNRGRIDTASNTIGLTWGARLVDGDPSAGGFGDSCRIVMRDHGNVDPLDGSWNTCGVGLVLDGHWKGATIIRGGVQRRTCSLGIQGPDRIVVGVNMIEVSVSPRAVRRIRLRYAPNRGVQLAAAPPATETTGADGRVAVPVNVAAAPRGGTLRVAAVSGRCSQAARVFFT